jgi:hypothetical protein
MCNVLRQSALNWIEEDEAEGLESTGQHGVITNSDHSYMRNGVLFTSVVCSNTLKEWVLVLWTFIVMCCNPPYGMIRNSPTHLPQKEGMVSQAWPL